MPLLPELSDATKEEIESIISRGLRKGLAPQEVARQVADKLSPYMAGRSRSEVRSVAHSYVVTKNASAYEDGSARLAKEIEAAGITMEKSWFCGAGNDACQVCRANADAGWIPLDQPFPSGHMHPPAHDACRCCDLHRVKE